MNKSDFISDAVALDLGKSGVKVAETLEIEVDEEWWNLINSKEQANLYTFTRRMEKQNPYEPGIFDMRDLKESTAVGMQGYSRSGSITSCLVPKMCMTAEGEYLVFQAIETVSGAPLTLKLMNLTRGITKTIVGPTALNPPKAFYAWWDSVNQVVTCMGIGHDNNIWYYMCVDKEGTRTNASQYNRWKVVTIYDVQSFPEDSSGTIYSLFWNPTSSAPWVRKTVLQSGQYQTNINSVLNDSQTGAVVLSAITSADPSHKLSMFYSRAYASVGVAWYNSGLGIVQYVLEKDAWAVVYSLPNLNSGGYLFNGISNLVIPNHGEFLITDWLTYDVGTLTAPAGYSFPENVLVFGATPIAGRKAIIWGAVSTTLYGWTLDYDTRSITYNGVITTEGFSVSTSTDFLFGNRAPTILHETETKLLLAFRGGDPIIMRYDKTSNTMDWRWSEWTNSSVFPTASSNLRNRNGMLFLLGENLMFFNVAFKTFPSVRHSGEFSNVPIESILNCSTTAELSALIVQGRFSYDNLNTSLQVLASIFNIGDDVILSAQNMESIKMTAEDANYYYLNFTMTQNDTTVENALLTDTIPNAWAGLKGAVSKYDYTLYVSKATMRPVAFYVGTNQISTRSAISTFGIKSNQRHRYLNRIDEAEGGDACIKRFKGNGISFKDYLTSANIKDTTSGGVASLMYTLPQGIAISCPLGKKNEALFYSIQDKLVLQYGASMDNAGNYGCFTASLPTLPFVPNSLMLDEWEDFAIAIGRVENNALPYCAFNAKTGFHSKTVAVKMADASVAECILPTVDSGGVTSMRMYGSFGCVVTATGKIDFLNTQVPFDYGTGTEPPEEFSNTIYNYEERSYIPYPFAREGIKVELSNISKMTKITLPETQTDLIRTMLASGTDFRGSRCVLRRVFPDHVEEGSDIVLLDGYIQDWSYSPDKKGILFTVSKTLIDVGASFPKRLMNMGCSHVFKGVRCGYLGEDGICTKTKTDCTAKGRVNQFGGFPWVAARQRRVMWR